MSYADDMIYGGFEEMVDGFGYGDGDDFYDRKPKPLFPKPLYPNKLQDTQMAKTSRMVPVPSRKPTPGKRPVAKQVRVHSSSKETSDGQGLLGIMPVGMIIHGTQGVGKTALAASFEDVGFMINRKERGIYDLVRAKQCKEPVFVREFGGANMSKDPGFQDAITFMHEIAGGDEGIKTLALDSLTFFETMGFHEDCNLNYDGDFTKDGYFAYQAGPKTFAKTMWTEFLDAAESVKDAGINVIMLAHTRVKSYTNPVGPNYDRFIPYLDAEVWNQTLAWAQLVMFYNFEVIVQEIKGSKGQRGKVKENSQNRMLYTQRTEAYDAKNRWGLSSVIDAGENGQEAYDNFISEFEKAFN